FAGHDVIAWTHAAFDVREHSATAEHIRAARPDVVINTAAFHKTDACEDDPTLAFAVNAIAVRNLAQVCAAISAVLVHISTDYVFGGDKSAPYTEDDRPNPINVYGASKLAGEHLAAAICPRHYIVRVASLFGAAGASGKGGNFVETMLGKARRGEAIAVVDDVTMSPTYTVDAAVTIRGLVEAAAPFGTYHVTNAGTCSWHGFAAEIFRQAGVAVDLRPTTIQTMASKAPRPRNSALASLRLHGSQPVPLRSWQAALEAYLGICGLLVTTPR
ncbi:MAG TPA: dTDP-4-dehydrorhamnose reductase, partial [Gemmatimonadales bacterium]|nr:dTDP-4-dehydrorhamnose reductase [Gemmatimonadales bacterium]